MEQREQIMGSNYGTTYNVDIAMVIDATGSMGPLLDLVRNNAMNFYSDLMAEMAKKRKNVDEVRVRVIAFRDYLADGNNAMLMTDFFRLPDQSVDFERLLRQIEPMGGGDYPEDGLEALAYAIKSKWTTGGSKRRHVIVVWSDDGTHELGFGRAAKNYPARMARSFTELSAWWGCGSGPDRVMDERAKRLLIYAPPKEYWTTIAQTWNNTLMFPSKAGTGLGETNYTEILDALCRSI